MKKQIKVKAWSLSKKKALDKLNDTACEVFRKVVDGLLKENVNIGEASITPKKVTGFLCYVGTYEIEVVPRPRVISIVGKVTYKCPTKAQVKKAKKKLYKRDGKGRFV